MKKPLLVYHIKFSFSFLAPLRSYGTEKQPPPLPVVLINNGWGNHLLIPPHFDVTTIAPLDPIRHLIILLVSTPQACILDAHLALVVNLLVHHTSTVIA